MWDVGEAHPLGRAAAEDSGQRVTSRLQDQWLPDWMVPFSPERRFLVTIKALLCSIP